MRHTSDLGSRDQVNPSEYNKWRSALNKIISKAKGGHEMELAGMVKKDPKIFCRYRVY